MYHYEYLNDAPFLQQLTESNIKEKYAKITILDWNEHRIEEITGRTLGGSINLDGTSSMRRTATLQLFAEDNDINNLTNIDNLISLNKKVELQIGLKNLTNQYQQYPIFWFPQGIFVIVGASIEHGSDGVKINLTLHDKMALLNGECGGTLPAPITFSEMNDEDEFGNILTTNPKISSIIKELVHHWGNEAERNIIVNNLDNSARQVVRWGGQNENPLHYFYIDKKNIGTKKMTQNIYDELVQLNKKIDPVIEEDVFYEQFMENLIQMSFNNNKYYKKYKDIFPSPKKIVQYFTESATSQQIKDLKIIVRELNNVYKNSKKLLDNLEEERSTLQTIKDKIDEQITTPLQTFVKKINNLQTFLFNFYEQKWKNAYNKGFWYPDAKSDTKNFRKAILTNCDKINLLKAEYQNKQGINTLKNILKELQTKVKTVQQSLGNKYHDWQIWNNNNDTFRTYGDKSKDYFIMPYNILTWLLWSGKTKKPLSSKFYRNIKTKNKQAAKEQWEANSNYFFDAPGKNKSIFVRRILTNGVDEKGKKVERGSISYGVITYSKNENKETSFFIPLYWKYYDTKQKKSIRVSGYEKAWIAEGTYLNELLFQDHLQSLKGKYNYPNLDSNSKKNLKTEINNFINYRPFQQLIKCCQYYKNESNFNATVANYLIDAFNKSTHPDDIPIKTAKEVFTSFLNLVNFLLEQVEDIENQYNYNIQTLEYIRKRAFSDKIYKTLKQQTDEKGNYIFQTFSEKIKEKIQQLKQLAEKLPIDFKVKMTVPGFFIWHPNYNKEGEITNYSQWNTVTKDKNSIQRYYQDKVTNLRDIGKYIVNNTGVFSELNSINIPLEINNNDEKPITKTAKNWIKQNHQFSIANLVSHMETSLKNYNFSQHNFNQILSNINKLIQGGHDSSFMPSKNEQIYWSPYTFIQVFYLDKFLNLSKMKEDQSIIEERKRLKEQSQLLKNKLQKIENNKLAISKGCNQVTKKWFKKELPSYEKLTQKLQEKSNIENKIKQLDLQKQQLNKYINKTLQSEKQITKTLNTISSANTVKDLIQASITLDPNAKNAINDDLIKGRIGTIEGQKYAIQSQSFQNATKQQQQLLTEFQANLKDNPILQASFQEKEIKRAEAELTRLQQETNVSNASKDIIKELNNIIKERQQDLQNLLSTLKKEKIKLFKNFFTDLKDNHKMLFFTAFGKAAFFKDLGKSSDSRRWGRAEYKMPTKIENLNANHLYIIYNSLFEDPAIKTSNTWRQNPLHRIEFFNNFYNNYCVPAYLYGKKQYKYGEDIGYTLTDFTYPGELSCLAGETIASVLDKIKNTLGNYEYFYDINGKFIFQEIPNYLTTSYSTSLFQQMISNKEFSFKYDMLTPVSYDLSNGKIIQSYQNSPQYKEIKNDFLIWGERETVSGQKVPIRYHLAIDTEPSTKIYYFLDAPNKIAVYHYKKDLPLTSNKICYVKEQNVCYEYINRNGFVGYKKVDLINNSKKFVGKLPKTGSTSKYYFNEDTQLLYSWDSKSKDYKIERTYRLKICEPKINNKGITGHYYYDLSNKIYVYDGKSYQLINDVKPLRCATVTGSILYLQGYQAEQMGITTNDYYTELKTEWPKIWDLLENCMYKDVKNELSSIDYFLNFLNSNNLVDKFNIGTIGRRTHVISNNAINCIFEPACPQIVFFDNSPPTLEKTTFSKQSLERENYEKKTKKQKIEELNQYNIKHASEYVYKFVNHSIYKYFKIGGIFRSAYEEIRSELYKFITYNEQISINILPMYYLEPNQIIKIQNDRIGIKGNFLVTNFSIPLDINSSMSLTCTKTISRI